MAETELKRIADALESINDRMGEFANAFARIEHNVKLLDASAHSIAISLDNIDRLGVSVEI